MRIKQTRTIQYLSIHLTADRNNNVTIGFRLISEKETKPQDCIFPVVTVKTLGIDKVVESKLVWEGVEKETFTIDTQLEKSQEVVYNLIKSKCKSKNSFQLYLSIQESDVPTEYLVAQGLAYIHLN